MLTPMQNKKRCPDCKKLKWKEDFGRNSSNKDGLYSYCRACVCRRTRARVEKDPDAHREYMRQYMQRQRLRGAEEGKRLRALYLARRFWMTVRVTDLESCWEWTGHRTVEGYGKVMRDGKKWPAHRLAWNLTYNDGPHGVVMHKCDNRACCNPLHLQDGTPLENTFDMIAKGRAASFGHEIMLTPEKVAEVRRLSLAGETGRAIAARMGVSTATISKVLTGKRWSSVA